MQYCPIVTVVLYIHIYIYIYIYIYCLVSLTTNYTTINYPENLVFPKAARVQHQIHLLHYMLSV